jgi:hypothetical protein
VSPRPDAPARAVAARLGAIAARLEPAVARVRAGAIRIGSSPFVSSLRGRGRRAPPVVAVGVGQALVALFLILTRGP